MCHKDASKDHEIFTVSFGKDFATRICNVYAEIARMVTLIKGVKRETTSEIGDIQPMSRRTSETAQDCRTVISSDY